MMRRKALSIETSSVCNRRCPTCIRNSHPDREFVKSWFELHLMPMQMIRDILEDAKTFKKHKWVVSLSYYNEPTMDPRIIDIMKTVKSYDFQTEFVTNGDFLSKDLASKMDGLVDVILVSGYENKTIKEAYFKTLFSKTELRVKKQRHKYTHYSPNPSLPKAKCLTENRLIINHKGEYLLCCEDFGNFDLGKFPEVSMKDYWYGKKRTEIAKDVMNGNRHKYEYCKTCPRV